MVAAGVASVAVDQFLLVVVVAVGASIAVIAVVAVKHVNGSKMTIGDVSYRRGLIGS